MLPALAALALLSFSLHARVDVEAARSSCLRSFARTVTCTASYEGRALRLDIDKEDLRAEISNYGLTPRVGGFYAKTRLLNAFPRWTFECSEDGKLTRTLYVKEHIFDVHQAVVSRCR
jgi:hypothetical protein